MTKKIESTYREITPTMILNEEILISKINDDEKSNFIKKYYITDTGLGPLNEVDRESSLIILKSLSVNDIFEIANSQNKKNNFDISFIDTLEFAHITKKVSDLFPKKFEELPEEEAIIFMNEVQELIKKVNKSK